MTRKYWLALISLVALCVLLAVFVFSGSPAPGAAGPGSSSASAESESSSSAQAESEGASPAAETTDPTEATEMELSLLAVNVGKADALLLRSGETAYLIDTGTKKSFDQLYRVLKEEGVNSLTGVILTHTDSDHVGGLKQLMESDLDIKAVYASAYYLLKDDKKKHPAVKALKKSDLEVQFIRGGDRLPLDGGTLEVLGPLEESDDKDDNNSLVMLATGGGGSMLLAGDMEFPEEESLLKARAIPKADVLKVGNHGDDDATSDALIQAVSPKVAVISTSTAEKADTPSPRVLRLLNSWKIAVLQTQETENGVLVTLRGGEIFTEMK